MERKPLKVEGESSSQEDGHRGEKRKEGPLHTTYVMEDQKLIEEVARPDDRNIWEELQTIGGMFEDLLKKHEDLVKKDNDFVAKHDEDLLQKCDDFNQKYDALLEKHDVLLKRYNDMCDDHKKLTMKQKDLVQKLQDKVECHALSYFDVSKKAPSTIPVCPNGHVVCTKCVKEECPPCRVKEEKGKHDALIEKHDALVKDNNCLLDDYKELTKKHKDLVQQLRDKVECPVCLVVPSKAPIPVCPNGHVVCAKCVREDCPMCRVKMEQGKSTLAVTVIENLDHQCENEGCHEIITFKELVSHGKKCHHRLVTCPDLNCDDKISLSSLATHMVSSSCLWDEILVHKLPHTLSFSYSSYDQPTNHWTKSMRFGQHILILKVARYVDNGIGRWYFLLHLFGGTEETSGYRVTIIVHKTEGGPDGSYSQRYDGDACPVDVTSMEAAYEKGLCLTLSDGAMNKLLSKKRDSDQGRSFSVSVNIFGTDIVMS